MKKQTRTTLLPTASLHLQRTRAVRRSVRWVKKATGKKGGLVIRKREAAVQSVPRVRAMHARAVKFAESLKSEEWTKKIADWEKRFYERTGRVVLSVRASDPGATTDMHRWVLDAAERTADRGEEGCGGAMSE